MSPAYSDISNQVTAMNLRPILTIGMVFFSCAMLVAKAQIPSDLRETRAVYADLQRLQSECDQMARITADLRRAIRSVRSGIDDSITTTAAIRSLDRRMVKLIDRLKPYSSIPKVRTVIRTLSKNLQRVQDQLHAVRKKTDQCEKTVLRPTRKRLQNLELGLNQAESRLRQMSGTTAIWMENLRQAAIMAQQVPAARATLESSARATRPVTKAAADSVARINPLSHTVGNLIQEMNRCFGSYRVVRGSIDETNRKMEPGEEFVEKLDRTMAKKLTIRNPFTKKALVFSVRDILEKPGEVIGIVLKPLEKLVDKLLQPILRKAKLEMRVPRGLNELSAQVTRILQIERELSGALSQLERHLDRELENQIRVLQAEANKTLRAVKASVTQLQTRRSSGDTGSDRQPPKREDSAEQRPPAMFLIWN
jgi:hypothetical protein